MFDPYYKWLGIPTKDQPPNHYRLLGLERFEADPDVIETAADKQMAFIRTCATGKHVTESQKLLNEIAAARVCLLNTKSKSAYDKGLRQMLAATDATKSSTPVRTEATHRSSDARPQPIPLAKPLTTPAVAQSTVSIEVSPSAPTRTSRRTGLPTVPLAGITAALIVIVAAILLFSRGDRPSRVAPVAAQQVATQDKGGHAPLRASETHPIEQLKFVVPPPDTLVDSPKAISESAETGKPELELPPGEPSPPVVPPPVLPAATDATPSIQPSNVAGLSPTAESPESSKSSTVPAPPTGQALEAAERLFQEVYESALAEAKTAQQKGQLAEKLWMQASEEKDPAIRYVLLRESSKTAASAEDVALAFRAVEAMEAAYRLDHLSVKIQVLQQVARRPTPGVTSKIVVEKALLVVQQAVDADRYVDAKELAELALSSARTSKDSGLIKQSIAVGKRVTTLSEQYASIAEARAILETAPDDPHANAVVGKFLCLIKGDWERGLPSLTKGDDNVLKALAERDGTASKDASQQVAIGDSWWELAEAGSGDAKSSLQVRAAHWYRTALPQLTGLAQTRVEKRLSSIELADWAVPRPQTVSERTLGKATPGTQSSTKQAVTEIVGHSGFGTEFRDVAPQDKVLVGFNVTFARYGTSDAEAVGSLQPIYGSAEEVAPSAVIGNKSGKVTSVTARQGFAVVGVRVHANTRILGLQLAFAKRKGTQFDVSTVYTSDWVGRPNDASPIISGQRNSVVGITGWWAKESIRSLGLICSNPGQSE